MYFTTTHFALRNEQTIDAHLTTVAKEKGATLVQVFRTIDTDGDKFYECVWFAKEYSYWDQFLRCDCSLHR